MRKGVGRVRTLEYLTHYPGLYAPAVVAGLAIAVMGGAASVLVVVRRLAMVGQGVSHAAFGAVGIAAALGLGGAGAVGTVGQTAIVGVFCIAAALGMAWLSDRKGARFGLREDTVIAVFLVASMALGAVLLRWAAERGGGSGSVRSVESWLFGSIFEVGRADAVAACLVAAAVVGVLWVARRRLIFWVFDEGAAEAFGVDVVRTRAILLVVLAVAIVVAMKLAGVLLATSLLVLPGATALRLTDRLWTAQAISVCAGVVGVAGGLVLSFETDWLPGPSIVAVQVALLGLTWLIPRGRTSRAAS